jgi:pilus assembly protein CpaE
VAAKIRVLVVDDFAEARTSVAKLLQFEDDIEMVGGAEDGPNALQMAQELQPDIILMDINMPGMDGIRATEAISSAVPVAQVIMMSVQGETDYLRRAMLAGVRPKFMPKLEDAGIRLSPAVFGLSDRFF